MIFIVSIVNSRPLIKEGPSSTPNSKISVWHTYNQKVSRYVIY